MKDQSYRIANHLINKLGMDVVHGYILGLLISCCLLAAIACEAGNIDLSYPRPDMRRNLWLDLNGKWDFAFDDKDAGVGERWYAGHKFDRKINVPYPYQAKLSGVGETEHHKVVWYSRRFKVPAEFTGERVRLHIGAADYAVTIWINGKEIGKDEGGYVPIQFDITSYLHDGENEVVVRVFDDPVDPAQPRGKQHPSGSRNRWHYTHITGIWQPVWLEAVPVSAVESLRIMPHLEPRGADITVNVSGGDRVHATVLRNGEKVTSASASVIGSKAQIDLSMPNAELWSPDDPVLYDLVLEVMQDGKVVDKVQSYFGIRTVSIKGNKILLNGKPIWQNMALVQGYWPDGLYVPPSPDYFVKDIEYCKQLGLNSIRMHQKVEDPRFLYLCDKMGLMVWGEMANAGEGHFSKRAAGIADAIWKRVIERDFNHPSIITWTYSNEYWMHHIPASPEEIIQYTKAHQRLKRQDPTRPVIDTSGYLHISTDIWDVHGCAGISDVTAWTKGGEYTESMGPTVLGVDNAYHGLPIVRSEWVFGDFDKPSEDWYKSYENEVVNMAKSGVFCGQCYVQLNDVENELNGYLKYDRTWKVDPKHIADMHAKATQAYELEQHR